MIITSGQSNFDVRPHRRRTWTVQSYSPGGANVHPIYRKQKMVAMATSLRCRVSAVSAFCRPTTQTSTSLHKQLPRRCRSHIAN